MSQVMFDAVKRVGDGNDSANMTQYDSIVTGSDNNHLMIHICGGYYVFVEGFEFIQADILTPTDILGPELVKAIEEGYTPWFEGDDEPLGVCRVVLANGEFVKSIGDNWSWSKYNEEDDIIAYKLSYLLEPSFESKALSEKVGPSIFDLDVEQFGILKELKHNLDRAWAVEANRPYVQGIIDQLSNKGGE